MTQIRLFLRPHLKEFLQELSEVYDIAVFTAAHELYANEILSKIDPTGRIFQMRLYRTDCSVLRNK